MTPEQEAKLDEIAKTLRPKTKADRAAAKLPALVHKAIERFRRRM